MGNNNDKPLCSEYLRATNEAVHEDLRTKCLIKIKKYKALFDIRSPFQTCTFQINSHLNLTEPDCLTLLFTLQNPEFMR